MDDLRFSELRRHNVARCYGHFHDLMAWTETDWACAAAGEMGEMCNLIKKRRRGECNRRGDVALEMADVVIYLDLLAARMGIDLGAAVRAKFNKTSDTRGYSPRLDKSGRIGCVLYDPPSVADPNGKS